MNAELSSSFPHKQPPPARIMTALFRDREDFDRAYHALLARGYAPDEVNIMMSDEARRKHFELADDPPDSKALEGAGVGSAVGGTLGALVAAVAAIGTNLVLPGLGLVIAGPLAAAFAGAGAGGLAGGIVGALAGAGIPEERARAYEQSLREGGLVLGVHPRSEEDAAYLERVWSDAHAEHVWR